MDSKQNILIKIDFQGTKLKYQIQDSTITFQELKVKLCERLKELGQNVEADNLICSDEEKFNFTDTDQVNGYLKNNDLVNLLEKPNQQKVVQQITDNQQNQTQTQEQNPLVQSQDNAQVVQNQIQQSSDEAIQLQRDQIVEEEEMKQQMLAMKQQVKEDPIEAIVVLFDVSGSMRSSFFDDKDLSRMGAVNALFSAFADKTLAFEYNHIVKLVTFASNIQDKCEFTNDFNMFIRLVDGANPGGGTKCFDAVYYAIGSLLEIKKKYPNIIMRIIALTDGEDNESRQKPSDLANLIRKNRITMDSFVVGSQCDGLKKLTHASGGRCYCPQDINVALNLFELETILSVSLRAKSNQDWEAPCDFESFAKLPFDTDGIQMAKSDSVYKPSVDPLKLLAQAKKNEENQKQAQGLGSGPSEGKKKNESSAGGGAYKRVIKELQSIVDGADTRYRVYPTGDNIFSWKILLKGPADSPYAGGLFFILCTLPNDYPFKPPKINYDTKIFHCNISSQGNVCLDILKDSWSPALTVEKVLVSLLSLMKDPNPDDALDSNAASLLKHEPEKYKEKQIEYVKKYAKFDATQLASITMGQSAKLDDPDFILRVGELQKWLS